MKFYQYYNEAVGSLLGMVVAIYCYLNGTLIIYSNLVGNYDTLTFSQVIASYTLYPFCLLTFIISIYIAYCPECENNKFLGMEINNINTFFKYSICIIGILSCSIFFIIPTVFMLLGDVTALIWYILSTLYMKISKHKSSKKEAALEQDIISIYNLENETDDKIFSTRVEMAIQLLNKNASMDFIQDITGLSTENLQKLQQKLQKEALNYKSKE